MEYIPEGHKNKPDSCLIGFIYLKDIGKCKVEVFDGNEENIPYFHIYNEDNSFHTCVCIYSNEYYNYNNKCKNRLSQEQCIQLNEWMKSIESKFPYQSTNWFMCAFAWEVIVDRQEDFPKEYDRNKPTNYSIII